jgi:hypothetical protein
VRPQSGQACPCRRKPATVIFTFSGRTTGFRWDTVLGPFSAVRATFAHIRKTGSITLVAVVREGGGRCHRRQQHIEALEEFVPGVPQLCPRLVGTAPGAVQQRSVSQDGAALGRKWDQIHLDLMTCEVGRRNVDDNEAEPFQALLLCLNL